MNSYYNTIIFQRFKSTCQKHLHTKQNYNSLTRNNNLTVNTHEVCLPRRCPNLSCVGMIPPCMNLNVLLLLMIAASRSAAPKTGISWKWNLFKGSVIINWELCFYVYTLKKKTTKINLNIWFRLTCFLYFPSKARSWTTKKQPSQRNRMVIICAIYYTTFFVFFTYNV
jgi:hypothetical protein